jgi:hypothetical protein
MKRRDFIKGTAATGFLILAPGITACTPQDLSMERALSLIDDLKKSPSLSSRGDLSAFQIIMHCTQSVDCARIGYPEMKAAWFQSSIGKAAFHAFSMLDKMKHDRSAPIPGMPAPQRDGNVQEALALLEQSFRNLKDAASIHPHFFFGELSPHDMERIQVMHFFNHMELLNWKKV